MRFLNHRANLPKSSIFRSLSALSIRLCATKIARSFLLMTTTLLALSVSAGAQSNADPYLRLDSASVQEGDSGTTTMTFTARLIDANGHTQASTKTITANYEVLSESNDSATAGTDYTAKSGGITFAPGETSKTINVSVMGDTEVEGDETLTVKWTGWSNVWLTHYTAIGTITNDDSAPPPVISATVTIADASAEEGDSIFFTVTLDNDVPDGLTVTPSFTDGTATNGSDYTANTNALNFTGTAGEKQTFTVLTTEDDDVEDNETFTIGLSVSGTTHDITASDTATGTINNDDSAPTPVPDPYLRLDSASVQEGDSGTTTMTFTARLIDVNGHTQASTKTITANYTVLSESNDSATAGTDYTATSGGITFAPGETSKTIDVTILGDTEVEGDETLTVKWTGWENVWLTHYTAIGTITNDDSAPPPVISAAVTIDDASADEGDALSFSVTLDNAVPGGLTVTPSFTNGTAASSDYTANTNALNFTGTAGETQTFTVATIEDTDVEANETFFFTVGLSVSGTTHSITASDTATGTITNDDKAPVSTPVTSATLTIADASADEGDALSFTVTLNKAVPGGFTVTPSFTDGATVPGGDLSALTAKQGSDYSAGTLTLNFAGKAGETVTFTVPTLEDQTVEYPELFTVGLAVSGTSHQVTATDTATGIIRDDDANAGASIMSDRQIQDKGSYLRLWSPPDPVTDRYEYYCDIPKRIVETTNRSTRSKLFQIPCKVHQGGIPAGAVIKMWSTGSATATNGSSGNWDYNFYHSEMKMYPGDYGIQRLSFRINDDQGVEKAESFQFAIKWTTKVGYPPFWFTLNESVHTLTTHIDDDDEYQLTVSPESVTEGGGAQVVTVTATNTSGAKLSEARKISVEVGAGTDFAVEGTDYQTVNKFDITIPSGSSSGSATFTLTPIDDAHLEAGERITLSGSGSSQINGSTLTPRVRDTSIWITDSEIISLSATPNITEGGGTQTVTLTATMSGTAQRAIPLTISAGQSGDSAIEGSDFHDVSDAILSISAGSVGGSAMGQAQSSNTTTLGTIQITPINDTTLENDETITISASTGTFGLSSAIPDASIKLIDDDVQLSLSPASVGEEGGAQTVTVTARVKTARTNSRTLTVSVGELRDQATEGTDYGAVSDFSLTIAANQTSGTATFTVRPIDDKIIEGSERITVSTTGAGLDYGGVNLPLTDTDTTTFRVVLIPNTVPEDGNARKINLRIETENQATFPHTVTCYHKNGGGNATWDGDYVLSDRSNQHYVVNGQELPVQIRAGETVAGDHLVMRAKTDNTVEGDETVTIKARCIDSYGMNQNAYPADITITDDETSISLGVSPSSVAENAGATSVTVTARMGGNRNAPADMPVTITVGKTGDSATSGTDYEAVETFKITIPSGSKSATKTITFTPIDDTLNEGSETLTLSGKTPKTSVSDTVLTITDNETNPYVIVNNASVLEGNSGTTKLTFTARLTNAMGQTKSSTKTVTAAYQVSSESGDTATAGTDYTATSGTLTFAPGETSKTVDVSVARRHRRGDGRDAHMEVGELHEFGTGQLYLHGHDQERRLHGHHPDGESVERPRKRRRHRRDSDRHPGQRNRERGHPSDRLGGRERRRGHVEHRLHRGR